MDVIIIDAEVITCAEVIICKPAPSKEVCFQMHVQSLARMHQSRIGTRQQITDGRIRSEMKILPQDSFKQHYQQSVAHSPPARDLESSHRVHADSIVLCHTTRPQAYSQSLVRKATTHVPELGECPYSS